ncbi:MAG: TonB-dependent receptor, partial [Alphaproteobacteria bacterium]|nr:TonB-dependent receptor [Alphaproteobacteria bacterium]
DVILGTTVGLNGLTASTFGDVDTKTYSFFGDFTYDFTDQLSLSVGGRWTSDKREATVLRRNLLNGPSVELGGTTPLVLATTSNFTGEKTFKQFTPRASVAYKPTDDHTLYGSYSKGFKGGGFDPRGLTTAARDFNGNGTVDQADIFEFMSFDPEKVDSYEIGWKAQFFDRTLTSNIALFHADYTDVQIPGSQGIVIGGVPTFIGITTNAGKAKMDGIEWEGSARGFDGFAGEGSFITANWSFGYLDARYTRFIGATGTDVSAQRVIQNTPKYTLSNSLTANFPVNEGMLSATFGTSFRSKTSQFETRSPLDQAAYSLYDASLVWRSDDDKWTVGLYGKNLADKKYIVSGYNFLQTDPATGNLIRNPATGNPIPTLGREGVLTAFYGNPRQIFASVGVKF